MMDNGLVMILRMVLSALVGILVYKLLTRMWRPTQSVRSLSEEDEVRRLSYRHAPAPVTNDFHADCLAVHEERMSYEELLDRWRDHVPPRRDRMLECFKEIMTREEYSVASGDVLADHWPTQLRPGRWVRITGHTCLAVGTLGQLVDSYEADVRVWLVKTPSGERHMLQTDLEAAVPKAGEWWCWQHMTCTMCDFHPGCKASKLQWGEKPWKVEVDFPAHEDAVHQVVGNGCIIPVNFGYGGVQGLRGLTGGTGVKGATMTGVTCTLRG